jgi:hypothetical protein
MKVTIDRARPLLLPKELQHLTSGRQDLRSIELTEIDVEEDVLCVPCGHSKDDAITGITLVHWLQKEGWILPDIKVMCALWNNREYLPSDWKREVMRRPSSIYFDGTELYSKKHPEHSNIIYTPYIFWSPRNAVWTIDYSLITAPRDFRDTTLVIKKR